MIYIQESTLNGSTCNMNIIQVNQYTIPSPNLSTPKLVITTSCSGQAHFSSQCLNIVIAEVYLLIASVIFEARNKVLPCWNAYIHQSLYLVNS